MADFIQLKKGNYTISIANSNYYVVIDVFDTNEVFKQSESFTSWNSIPFTFSLTDTRKIRILIKLKIET